MNAHQYLVEMAKIQVNLLQFLDDESNIEENFQELSKTLMENNINKNKRELTSVLYFILKISNNHQRHPNFFNKIERTLTLFQDDIRKFFTNLEIFNFFWHNKRILLFFIEKNIFNFDEIIIQKMIKMKEIIDYKSKYMQYFQPEINPFRKHDWFPQIQRYGFNRDDWVGDISKPLPDDFYERRKEGENESEICQLIRKGSAKDFISYISKNNISLDSTINPSIYETNSLLVKKQEEGIKLIEYAAFFGSYEIVNYLIREKQELTQSLWLYAIHGQNSELIHILEDNHILPEDETYTKCLNESLKCHDIDTTQYILNNLLSHEESVENELEINLCLKNYNFIILKEKDINDFSIYDLVKYDYYILLENLLKNTNIDVNKVKSYDNEKDKKYEKTAIYMAVEKENLEMVKLLLENENLDINCMNKITELNFDPEEGYNDDNYTFKETKETPLFLAVKKENLDIIKLFLSKKQIDLNDLNMCVYKCIYEDDNKYSDFSDAFIDNNEDPYEDDNYGQRKYEKKTALFLAVEKNNLEIIKLLLKNESIDPNIINIIRDQNLQETFGNDDYYNLTALYFVISNEFDHHFDDNTKIEIIKLLLENEKTDPNIINYLHKRDFEGGDCFIKKETAFFLAIENECWRNPPKPEIIELLLKKKKIDFYIQCTYIDLEMENGKFFECEPEIRNPLEFASRKSNKETIELLHKYLK